MRTFHDPRAIDPDLRGGVVSLGNFDGLHRGHAALLRAAGELARGGPVLALTFEPHPVVLLAPQRAPRRLTPPAEKLRQLAALGVAATVVLPTDRALLSLSAEEFVERLLAGCLEPAHVVEGPTFGFGAGRRGSAQTLRELGPRFGFAVHVVEPLSTQLTCDDPPAVVSSSLIRTLLAAGDLDAATAALGRRYSLIGSVVHGAGQGRALGFPTINLDCGDQQLPADAVYAARASFEDDALPPCAAAVSIGCRPTFAGQERVVEAHLLDVSGDFYARTARLELVARLREQRSFDSPARLAEQIAQDVVALRRVVTEPTRSS